MTVAKTRPPVEDDAVAAKAGDPEPTPTPTPTPSDNKSYKCLGWLSHNNVTYSPGSWVQLTDAEAEQLAAFGVIELPGV